jgi:FkbM family methyltransferase
MMLPLQEILNKYNIHPKGVVSVGSHWAEEHEEFVKCGIGMFMYIEPCKEAYDIIIKKLFSGQTSKWAVDYFNKSGVGNIYGQKENNIIAYNVACGAEEGESPMYVSHQNQGQSNSLLKPNLHLQQHPEIIFDDAEIVKVIPLDNLLIEKGKYDFLYMDAQGFEGEVLKGATETLKHIDIIMTECNRGQTYEGNMEIDEMDAFLKQYGFERKETYWPSPNWTWGDCCYIKTNRQ